MKQTTWMLTCLGMLAFSTDALSLSPEQERLNHVQAVQQKYPDIKFEDYVYGALAFSPDAKAQYENMMAFPPFESEIDKGRQLWETPFNNGKRYADCFPGGGRNVAGNYPYYDEAMKKVVTFEMALNQCRANNGEAPYKQADMNTMGLLTA
jgi:sulfur-oxidizing protein SoxA